MLIFFNFESRRRRNSNESQVKIQEESIQTLSSIHPLSESLSLSFPESNAAPNVYVTFLVSRFSTQSQLCTGGNNIYLAESRSSIVGLTHITWSRDSLRSPARRQLKLGSNNFPSRRGDGCNVLRDVSSSSLERPTENKHERTISKIVLTSSLSPFLNRRVPSVFRLVRRKKEIERWKIRKMFEEGLIRG